MPSAYVRLLLACSPGQILASTLCPLFATLFRVWYFNISESALLPPALMDFGPAATLFSVAPDTSFSFFFFFHRRPVLYFRRIGPSGTQRVAYSTLGYLWRALFRPSKPIRKNVRRNSAQLTVPSPSLSNSFITAPSSLGVSFKPNT